MLQQAIRLNPRLVVAHMTLGVALKSAGRFAESLAAYEQAASLASPGSEALAEVRDAIRQLNSDTGRLARLESILKREAVPMSNEERLALGLLAYETKHYAGAARLWAEVLESDPTLADDRQAQHRYNAACVAALAAAGEGMNKPPLDGQEKARLRTQALSWLQAELEAWTKLLESATPEQRQAITQTLAHWQQDPDLAAIRDTEALAKLPEDEQNACTQLWVDVAALLRRAEEKAK